MLFLLLACSDTTAADLDALCHAEERSGAASIQDPGEKAGAIAAWLTTHLDTPGGHALIQKIAGMDPAEKTRYLESEAKAHGIADCPMATMK